MDCLHALRNPAYQRKRSVTIMFLRAELTSEGAAGAGRAHSLKDDHERGGGIVHLDETGGVEEEAERRAHENGNFCRLRWALCTRVDVGVPVTESGAHRRSRSSLFDAYKRMAACKIKRALKKKPKKEVKSSVHFLMVKWYLCRVREQCSRKRRRELT